MTDAVKALLARKTPYQAPWWTRKEPGICEGGRNFATGNGTTPCRFRSTWLVSRGSQHYELCGTHKNAALRDERDYVAERL